MRWDIFCTVIDNYGDIGVAWRLARQLQHEYGFTVRLWVDDLSSFARIAPGLDATAAAQHCNSIEIRRWTPLLPAGTDAADVVIEAFGCRLPDAYLDAMAARPTPPAWINLEYLSAEDWVEGCHALSSPHPRLPLTKHFFFPGFTPVTGGLLCEDGLFAARDAWQGTDDAAWRLARGIPPRRAGELTVSLFAYENPAATSLLRHWATQPHPVTCLVPQGKVLANVTAALGISTLAPGDVHEHGALRVVVLPMSDQDGYDRLLWSCNLNFVRGEDSFVRAQWAARPLVWHIYPQDDDAHRVKLDAFLARYSAGLEPGAAAALAAVHHAWNHGGDMAAVWQNMEAWLPQLARHACIWPQKMRQQGHLVERLVQFIENRVQ